MNIVIYIYKHIMSTRAVLHYVYVCVYNKQCEHIVCVWSFSYTHLTLPTIYSV